jgi:hypothetical protein
MTTKEDYTAEEWNLLLLAPTNAATYIMTADMSVVGAVREMKALGKALSHPKPPETAHELVSSLLADIQKKTKNEEKLPSPTIAEDQDPREPARLALQQTASLLAEKCTPEEASGFKQWLMDIAQVVAEADKEGSHFGIGGQRVSDKEQAALAEIGTFLNP